jgi:hypothetical protein
MSSSFQGSTSSQISIARSYSGKPGQRPIERAETVPEFGFPDGRVFFAWILYLRGSPRFPLFFLTPLSMKNVKAHSHQQRHPQAKNAQCDRTTRRLPVTGTTPKPASLSCQSAEKASAVSFPSVDKVSSISKQTPRTSYKSSGPASLQGLGPFISVVLD